jgi:hypothetical protein
LPTPPDTEMADVGLGVTKGHATDAAAEYDDVSYFRPFTVAKKIHLQETSRVRLRIWHPIASYNI